MTEAKNWVNRNWQIITAVILVIFNVGYTVAKIGDKPDRSEVKQEIYKAIAAYNEEIKDNYIEIKKVPGLRESLDSINEKLKDLQSRFDKMEERVYFKH